MWNKWKQITLDLPVYLYLLQNAVGYSSGHGHVPALHEIS